MKTLCSYIVSIFVLTSEGHRRPRTELFFWFDIGGMVLQQPGGHPVQLSVGLLEDRDGHGGGCLGRVARQLLQHRSNLVHHFVFMLLSHSCLAVRCNLMLVSARPASLVPTCLWLHTMCASEMKNKFVNSDGQWLLSFYEIVT